MIGYFFRPETGREDRIGPTFGPFPEFLQLTYEALRAGPNGDYLMELGKSGCWYLHPPYGVWQPSGLPDGFVNTYWTDVVIWAAEVDAVLSPTISMDGATDNWWVNSHEETG